MELGYLPWDSANAAAQRLDEVGVRDDRVELTYRDFNAWIEAFAEQLAEHGFQRRDVVAIMLPNRVELLVAMFAAWRLGGAATPVNPVFTASEADYQIDDS
ncbi:MAG TPA: AMP-binding protein, partial [Nocardioidaceae bacterium]|nr:AMP-binding protein [Nocardioidaceae bacterium]